MNQIDETIQWLFENDAKEMKRICNKEMKRFGGISDMDYDDFYSQVGWDISVASKNFNSSKGKTFKEYVYGVIKLAVWKQMTKRNRGKRQIVIKKEIIDENGNITIEKEYVTNTSLDTYIGEDDNSATLGDMIASNIDIEKELLGDNSEIFLDEKVERYLDSLSKIQRKIVEMKMQNIEATRIKEELGLTESQYSSHMKEVVQFEHIRLLHIKTQED